MGAVIIDSYPCVRMALKNLIDKSTGLPVVGEAADPEQGLTLVHSSVPDLVVCELWLTGAEASADFFRRVKASQTPPRVLIFSEGGSPDQIMAALSAGADSYVHKSAPVHQITDAIDRTTRGERVWLFGSLSLREPSHTGVAPAASLTARESEVLILLSEHLSNEEIARKLGLARQTVKNVVSRVFRKLGVAGRHELFRGPQRYINHSGRYATAASYRHHVAAQ